MYQLGRLSAAGRAIYETVCLRRVGRGGVLKGAETTLRRGLVDIALCWVMSDAGLRRSEADATPRTVRNFRNN